MTQNRPYRVFGWALVCLAILAGVLPIAAQEAANEDDEPRITSFTTPVTAVSRSALEQRTARVPVSWTSVNRPITANLVFEQLLPDGSTVNVELPRVVPWVNSSGDGIAAPILPAEDVDEITLRVQLINLLTRQVYDEVQLTLPVSEGGGGDDGVGDKPTIERFTTSLDDPVLHVALRQGTARIPVSWRTINRPDTANLVFEQVLPDGSARNVELPREIPWVSSSGDGVVAPVMPAGDPAVIRLRVRLIDLLYGRVYDQRDLIIDIDYSDPPDATIDAFTTDATSADYDRLRDGSERIDVSWRVDNRPGSTNLVFEQLLPGGNARNAELPRDVPIVPSSGDGVVQLILPAQDADSVTFRVRLVDLGSGITLAQESITLPISGRPEASPEVTQEATAEPEPTAEVTAEPEPTAEVTAES